MAKPDPEAVTASRNTVRWLRDRYGYQPIPSRMEGPNKAPIPPYRDFWEKRGPDSWVEDYETTNYQLMTGVCWGLIAIDVDGPSALDVWMNWRSTLPIPRTWEVISPSGGRHIWFSIAKTSSPVPSRWIWTDGGDHSAIELMGDRKLIVCPPSIHVKHKKPYQFIEGCSPLHIARPAEIPAWILDLPEARRKPEVIRPVLSVIPPTWTPRVGKSGFYNARDVIGVIPDKIAIAREWGVNVIDGGGPYLKCHSLGKTDSTPNASISRGTGLYTDFSTGERYTLFELGVRLGHFATWVECKIALAERFGAIPISA